MGTVKLTDVGQWNSGVLALRRFNLSDIAPGLNGQRSHFAEIGGWHFVAWEVEQVGYGIVDGKKSLQMARRFEFLHHPLSLSRWLVGILGAVIQTLVRPMCDTGHNLPFCRSV